MLHGAWLHSQEQNKLLSFLCYASCWWLEYIGFLSVLLDHDLETRMMMTIHLLFKVLTEEETSHDIDHYIKYHHASHIYRVHASRTGY